MIGFVVGVIASAVLDYVRPGSLAEAGTAIVARALKFFRK
jgi:hypothetical protein